MWTRSRLDLDSKPVPNAEGRGDELPHRPGTRAGQEPRLLHAESCGLRAAAGWLHSQSNPCPATRSCVPQRQWTNDHKASLWCSGEHTRGETIKQLSGNLNQKPSDPPTKNSDRRIFNDGAKREEPTDRSCVGGQYRIPRASPGSRRAPCPPDMPDLAPGAKAREALAAKPEPQEEADSQTPTQAGNQLVASKEVQNTPGPPHISPTPAQQIGTSQETSPGRCPPAAPAQHEGSTHPAALAHPCLHVFYPLECPHAHAPSPARLPACLPAFRPHGRPHACMRHRLPPKTDRWPAPTVLSILCRVPLPTSLCYLLYLLLRPARSLVHRLYQMSLRVP